MTQKKIQASQLEIHNIKDAGGNVALQIADAAAGKTGFVFSQAGTGYGKIGADGTVADVDLRLDTLGNGKVKAYDGSGFAEVATITGTQTLTNKRITPRFVHIGNPGTHTPDVSTEDGKSLLQSSVLTVNAPTGTPTDGQKYLLRIKDNGTARSITWNAIYRAIGVTLPTTTIVSKTLYVGMVYNSLDTKWDVISVAQEN